MNKINVVIEADLTIKDTHDISFKNLTATWRDLDGHHRRCTRIVNVKDRSYGTQDLENIIRTVTLMNICKSNTFLSVHIDIEWRP